MSLGFVNSDAHWSYGGFHNFRTKLAKEIGIDLEKMAGFCEDGDSWDNIKDPIKLLLHHSDCEGHLTPAQCNEVAPRLRKLIVNWRETDWDKEQAELLAKGMEWCAKHEKNLEFC